MYTSTAIRRHLRVATAILAALFCYGQMLTGADTKAAIESVAISKPFFNPSLAENVRVSLSVASGGSRACSSLIEMATRFGDWPRSKPCSPGKVAYDWDGKDERGEVVPDEAYSLKADLESGGQSFQYFPANAPGMPFSATTNYYDRQGAVLSYTLPAPARVHIQAGVAKPDPKTGVL